MIQSPLSRRLGVSAFIPSFLLGVLASWRSFPLRSRRAAIRREDGPIPPLAHFLSTRLGVHPPSRSFGDRHIGCSVARRREPSFCRPPHCPTSSTGTPA